MPLRGVVRDVEFRACYISKQTRLKQSIFLSKKAQFAAHESQNTDALVKAEILISSSWEHVRLRPSWLDRHGLRLLGRLLYRPRWWLSSDRRTKTYQSTLETRSNPVFYRKLHLGSSFELFEAHRECPHTCTVLIKAVESSYVDHYYLRD